MDAGGEGPPCYCALQRTITPPGRGMCPYSDNEVAIAEYRWIPPGHAPNAVYNSLTTSRDGAAR